MSASASVAALRLQKELRLFRSRQNEHMRFLCLNNDSLMEWVVYVFGPKGTAYDNGIFRTLVRFPDSFPMDPPSIQVQSKFFHPNVYRDGKVCISTLQQPIPAHLRSEHDPDPALGGNWTPALNVESIFMSFISLLSDPNPDDPANAEAAKMYKSDRAQFTKEVQRIVQMSLEDLPPELMCGSADEPLAKRTTTHGSLNSTVPRTSSNTCPGCVCRMCGASCDRKAPCVMTCICDEEEEEEEEDTESSDQEMYSSPEEEETEEEEGDD